MGWAFREHRHDVIAGLTTFAAMSYVIFAVPATLQPIMMAPGPTLLWTCLMAFIATTITGYWLGTPTALACGMGLNLFIADYYTRRGIPWPHLLVTCLVVSVIVYMISVVPLRKNLISAVPPQIFAAVKAGVGSLLVKVAILEVMRVGAIVTVGDHLAMILFIGGLAMILCIKWLCAREIGRPDHEHMKPALIMLDSASFFISVVAMIFLTMPVSMPSSSLTPEPNLFWIWMGKDEPLALLADGKPWVSCIGFGIAVLFVLTMDIAGSPVEYVRPGNPGGNLDEKRKQTVIERSLKLDSAINILAPIAGVSPMVYYAENHVGWKSGGRSGWTAGTVAACFFISALIGGTAIWRGVPISELIPKFAVMPALFFVGLMIIAESFAQRFADIAATPGEEIASTPPMAAASSDVPMGRVYYFLPAAITVVMVNYSTFDHAIAAGILTYALISQWPESYVGKPENDLGALNSGDNGAKLRRPLDLGLGIGAIVVLLLDFLP